MLLLLVSVSGCSKWPSDDSSIFSNNDYSITYPPAWVVDDRVSFVYFNAPPKNSLDDVTENVVVYVTQVESGKTLVDFFQESVQSLLETTQGFTLLEHKEMTLSSEPAQRIVYAEKGEIEVEYLQVFTLKNDKAYIITYTAQPDNYEDYIEEVEGMIKSFRIK